MSDWHEKATWSGGRNSCRINIMCRAYKEVFQMRYTRFNDSWKFWKDGDSFSLVWNVPDHAETVTLPHDAMIHEKPHAESRNGGNTGFYDGDNYTYVHTFYADESMRDRTLMLRFEGVYSNALVYINEQLAGKNMYGYSCFYIPMNDFLHYGGDNEIRVQVRNIGMTNSRWYSGSGIYRDVYLLEAGQTYLVPDGLQIATENIVSGAAVLKITAELKNRQITPADIRLHSVIRNAKGEIAAEDETSAILFDQEERKIERRVTVDHPDLWSDENPALYRCETTIRDPEGNVLDSDRQFFGIRKLEVDAKRGFCVNGRPVKLRGACIHHDLGLLGAADYEEAEFRRAAGLKAAGFNAIRMSHHPAAPALLRACDAVGLYVMDELSDMWDRAKNNLDYALYFHEWWRQDLTAMVRKDFNHPSVVLYSIGNEIPEIGTPHGSRTAAEISSAFHELDHTRFTTAGINGVFAAGDRVPEIVNDVVSDLAKKGEMDGNVNDFMTIMDSHMPEIVVHKAITERLEYATASLDVAGYNYMTARYALDQTLAPNRVMVGSETYPPEIAVNWHEVKKYPNVIGDFTWTGWDYIGEAGVGIPGYHPGEGGFGAAYPCRLAYAGDIDITGYRRPASYFRQIVFGLRKDPYITVQNPHHYGEHLIKTPWVISDSVSSWSWKGVDGQPAIVEIYAAGDEVELMLNDRSLGRKPAGEAAGYRTLFEITYESGTLAAVSYEKGQEIGRCTLTTAEEIRLTAGLEDSGVWMDSLRTAYGADAAEKTNGKLFFVDLRLEDRKGIVATDQDQEVRIRIEGGAEIAGYGSGDPRSTYDYTGDLAKTWNGRALLVLKRTGDGPIIVKAKSESAGEAEVRI